MTRDYSARAHDRAQYLLAGQSGTHTMPYREPKFVRGGTLPGGLSSLRDLDYLDASNPLFTCNRALYSAGQHFGWVRKKLPPGTFSRRPGVTILTDSGGLQFARGRRFVGDPDRHWTLKFAEANADEAISLDIPTVAVDLSNPQFGTPQACLSESILNNRYWLAHRRRTDMPVLTVLQGRSAAEAWWWYDGIRTVATEGWAFGGLMRSNYLHLAEMCLRIIADGLMGDRIHVLGDSSLTQAVMLTALQRSLRRLSGNDKLLITFDTSTPSHLVFRGKAFGHAILSRSSFTVGIYDLPSAQKHAGKPYRFPAVSSTVAERMGLGDLSTQSTTRQHGLDVLGGEILLNHNTEALLRAIEEANNVMELPTKWAAQIAPPALVQAYDAMATMWKFPRDPVGHLRRFGSAFKAI